MAHSAGMERRLGLLPATALNMANMVGVGPFITIPDIMANLPGTHVFIGWACGLVLALADSMMWCELGAALPGSGGTYHYLREVFRPFRIGRLLPFLFIWQFIFSGPLEAASGCIGFVRYLNVLWPAGWGSVALPNGDLTLLGKLVASGLVGLAVLLLYRRIDSIGKLTVLLWGGMLVTVVVALVTAATRFDPALAFAPRPLPSGLGFALGGAMAIAMYDFLGYYDICYLGDEVKEPVRTIPRAVVISVFVVAAIYASLNLGVLGAVPYSEVVSSKVIFTRLVEGAWGPTWAKVFTLLVLWTAFASVFALLLGYSRIPFAAARDGYFFRSFADLHPREGFPRLSLLVLGAVTAAACWFPFMDVLTALLTSRILVQFVAQIGAVAAIRRYRPDIRLPFRMWLYPLPCFIALGGWLFIFGTAGRDAILFGVGTLLFGVILFFFIFRRAPS